MHCYHTFCVIGMDIFSLKKSNEFNSAQIVPLAIALL